MTKTELLTQRQVPGSQDWRELTKVSEVIDFPGIFRHTLASIDPLTESEGVMHAKYLGFGDSLSVLRSVPAIVFSCDSSVGIWIENPKSVIKENSMFNTNPHDILTRRLNKALEPQGLVATRIGSAQIVEDRQGEIHLLLDEGTTSYARVVIRKKADEFSDLWTDLAIAYDISTINGCTNGVDGRPKKIFTLVDDKVIGRIRKDGYLRRIAIEYGLTNTQYLRFVAWVHNAEEAGISVVYEKMVEEILAEDAAL